MLDLETLKMLLNDYPNDSTICIASAQQPNVLVQVAKVTVEVDVKTGDYTFVLLGEKPNV